jgi:hypothetical protein
MRTFDLNPAGGFNALIALWFAFAGEWRRATDYLSRCAAAQREK